MRSSSERQCKIFIEYLLNKTPPGLTTPSPRPASNEKNESWPYSSGLPTPALSSASTEAVLFSQCHSKTLTWTEEVSTAGNEDAPLPSRVKGTCTDTYIRCLLRDAYRLIRRQGQDQPYFYPLKINIMKISSNYGGNLKEMFLVKRTYRVLTY